VTERIYLSSPHLSGLEYGYVTDALDSNWVAPLGPHVEAFERELCAAVGAPHAVALSSGTAALHLALTLVGVGPGDEVAVSTFTFAASVNPIVYLGATPLLIDSETTSWNMDPELLAEALHHRAQRGALPKAVVVVHIYGQSVDMDRILEIAALYQVPVIEDAAEALGASYKDRAPGTMGIMGIYSFNGNKIITTSGGGMLVSASETLVSRARKLATQARDPAPHYEHSEVGYNYRLSNVLAAIGRGQLPMLDERVHQRRRNFAFYRESLSDLPGIGFMPEAPWGRHSRWLSVVTVEPTVLGISREELRQTLEAHNIESRPVWKPIHRQPVFASAPHIGGDVADQLFERGLCLPSGSNLTANHLTRVVDVLRRAVDHASTRRPRPLEQRASA
jgi:pyridoxal phosphate-dependent aminotransferase EpsN